MKFFAKRTVELEKIASSTKLSANTANWSNEVLAHLYRQHAYLGKYSVNLTMQNMDEQTGYAYGFFEVTESSPPPVMANSPGTTTPQAPQGPSIRIPVVIANSKLSQFDVMILPDGSFWPLSEKRVAVAAFNPNPYSPEKPKKNNGSGQFVEEIPSSARGQSSPNARTGVLKTAGVLIDKGHFEKSLSKIAADSRFNNNKSIIGSLGRLSTLVADPKPEQASYDHQFTAIEKTASGFLVHGVSLGDSCVDVESFRYTNGAARKFLSAEMYKKASSNGLSFMQEAPGVEELGASDVSLVKTAGVYNTLGVDGTQTRSIVFTDVTDFSGNSVGANMVANDKGFTLQPDVAGTKIKDLDLEKLSSYEPKGEGFFVFGDTVTLPVTVKRKVKLAHKDRTDYYFEDMSGVPGKLIESPASNIINKVTQVAGDNTFMIPANYKFIPTKFSDAARVSSSVMENTKIASIQYLDRVVEVRPATYGIDVLIGGKPLEGASGLTKEAAAVVLGALGAKEEQAREFSSRAYAGSPVKFKAASLLTLKTKTAEPKFSFTLADADGVSIDLIKEASFMTDPDSVDGMLSLNYVTPENLQAFITLIPSFEQTLSKLSELLIAARLGVSEVPEAAVSSAVKGLDKAIYGLKGLELKLQANTSEVN